MKNPNGYGTVVKLSGNRRKPFVARKTVRWKDNGQPVFLIIGYYATKEEGLIALAEYNQNPYDIANRNLTLAEVYEKWKTLKAPQLAKPNRENLFSGFRYMEKIKDLKYREIRSFQMQNIIDSAGSYSRQSIVKNLFGHLDRFALEMDVINKMYSQLTKTVEYEQLEERIPFSAEEIKVLWDHEDDFFVGYVLIMIYSGWRITEFCEMKTEDVDVDQWTMKGGSKTISGKNRIVPIHSAIKHLVKRYFNPDHKRLILQENGTTYTAENFRKEFHSCCERFGMKHTPHEARHTFRSMLDSAGANQKCIDLMMGHKSFGVGERVYTHKTVEELREAIELISR